MVARSLSGSYAGSAASSKSSSSRRARAEVDSEDGQDILHRRSSFENGIFGVLYTLSKENSDTRVHIRWVLLKILIDGWQLFTAVVSPAKQPWRIDGKGAAWAVVGVLNFRWLADLGYGAYLAVLYSMVTLLAVNVGICVWVAWCFKEHKFPVVWPIHVLRVFSSVFFQAFDVTSLSILQLGISCRYTGFYDPRMRLDLFPEYSCMSTPHLLHAVMSALSLIVFVAIALLLNMAEVELNPKSRRPRALGHSGAEVMVFVIKVLLTLVDVFIGWRRVAACVYLALSLALAYQYIRWNPHLVGWMNYLKSGVAVSIAWASAMLMLLVFQPGVREERLGAWRSAITVAMLAGLAPACAAGAALSWAVLRRMTSTALAHLENAKPEVPLEDVCRNIDDPRDVELVARCCRVWKDEYNLEPDAVNRAHEVIKAGLAMFPTSPYIVLLHANFMIDVLGVGQSGNSRIEDANKLNPGLMCRFMIFVRQQQATQKAASKSTSGANMDLLGYVEYQRKQRMVVRFHREALQAMCNFWKALDASNVSFTHLSKALGKIESSVSQAQQGYRVVLQSYGNNPKLVRLYGRFLQSVKNDPWAAAEYFAEADRLEETKDGGSSGPLLPDGTPLGRMDELATAVLVISSTGEIQMANRQTYNLFGYKRGMLDGKPMSTLLAPHCTRWLSSRLSDLVAATGFTAAMGVAEANGEPPEAVVVGMHYDRMAFSVKIALSRASGTGDDCTFIALLEPLAPAKGVSSLWVAHNGTIAACDPQFVSAFGWKATEVNGVSLLAFLSVPSFQPPEGGEDDEEAAGGAVRLTESASDTLARLVVEATVVGGKGGEKAAAGQGLPCLVAQKYDSSPATCTVSVVHSGDAGTPVYEVRLKLPPGDREQLLVSNRKGAIVHVTSELAACLKDASGAFGARGRFSAGGGFGRHGAGQAHLAGPPGAGGASLGGGGVVSVGELLAGYTLPDFLPMPWKEMHLKFLKDTTSLTPPARGPWACRKSGPPGPILELRSAGGRPLFMRVSVSTTEMGGEFLHVAHLAKSSLEQALAERRLRLSVSAEGLVAGFASGPPAQLLGLDLRQVVGRGLWEIVEDLALESAVDGRPSTPGPRMLNTLISRAVANPGVSWRVRVSPPLKARSMMSDLEAAARNATAKTAIMQLSIETPPDEDGAGSAPSGARGPTLFVDLWPTANATGVLELDASGRILSVLEERTRPAGLLFGLPSSALVGGLIGELIALPPGRSAPGDLLSLGAAKKSNLKANKKESGVKVGPMHVLQAAHADSRPLTLEVQVVGRPGPNQPCTVILRPHAAPLLPATATAMMLRAPAPPPPPPPAELPSPTPAAVASLRPSGIPGALSRMASGMSRAASTSLLGTAPAGGSPAAAGGSLPATPKANASIPRGSAAAATAASHMWEELEKAAPRSTFGGFTEPSVSASPRRTTDIAMLTTSQIMVTLPAPPDLLGMDAGGSLPQPGVTTGKAAARAGRSKLADLVKSLGVENAPTSPSSASERLRPRASGRFTGSPAEERRPNDEVGDPRALPGAIVSVANATEDEDDATAADTKGAALDLLGAGAGAPEARGVDDQDEDSDGGASGEKVMHKGAEGAERISAWVASKGAFYQNSIGAAGQSDDELGAERGMLGAAVAGGGGTRRSSIDAFVATKGAPAAPKHSGDAGGYDDDDARSEGGASGMSGQSGTAGAEGGRRFRRLVKMMNSVQAQKVQERLRRHAVATVAVLGLVHIICFVLVVIAIGDQRSRMALLGRNGEAQRYMQQVMTDVRSLDIISRGRELPNLYDRNDSQAMLQRVEQNADQLKVRLNAILQGNHDPSSPVLNLLFYSNMRVWEGFDGTYSNQTTWEALTRFYAMSMHIVQNYKTWESEGVHVASTTPGQYLLKTGPDLYGGIRKVMDALLLSTVDSVKEIDSLQIIFLALEGCAVSCIAACYLAHLLRAVAAQRMGLYRVFLMIPLGLTRALASQNTALLVDDDDGDEDLDDEVIDKAAVLEGGREEEANGPNARGIRRRSVVLMGEGGADTGSGRAGRRGFGSAARGEDVSEGRASDRGLLPASGSINLRASVGCWSSLKSWFGRGSNRFGRGVSPLPHTSSGGVAGSMNASSSNRRNLKNDSYDTIIMLTPFLIWSTLVITIYITTVMRMKGMIEAVAIHSVVNRISARTFQAVFFAQELAAVEDPTELPKHRSALTDVLKLARDAWLTLELGHNAYKAGGAGTEQFPLVGKGLAYASPELSELFYGTDICVRLPEHFPCPGPDYRFYRMITLGLDALFGQFAMALSTMANSQNMVPEGLGDEHFDIVYNVGTIDLVDGTIKMRIAHYDFIVRLFNSILLLHVVLLLLLFVIVTGFIVFLLNPLLKRVVKERRRIAELMSQLPMELDVEKMIARALGTTAAGAVPGASGGAAAMPPVTSDSGYTGDQDIGTSKWRSIIRRSGSSQRGRNPTHSAKSD